MKKYLSIFCAVMMLTALISCGDSSSISETPEMSESIVLDSVFENNYLKISTNSDWEESNDIFGHTNYIDWQWEDENSSKHNITLDITEDDSGEISLEDFRLAYENNDGYMASKHMYSFNFEKDKLIDSFEANTQAYIITGDTRKHNIFFKTDTILGEFVYLIKDEEIVMDMIKSIEFKTIEPTTKTTTKYKTKRNTYTTKSKENAEKVTQPVTEPPTEKPVETQPPVIETSPIQTTVHFILNLETNCIHTNPNCSAVLKILPENYSTVDIAEDDLVNYNGTYWACGKCSKEYTNILPKF